MIKIPVKNTPAIKHAIAAKALVMMASVSAKRDGLAIREMYALTNC